MDKVMTVRLRKGVSMAEVEYGTALLDEERGEYYNLNPTGALILETLLSGGSADQAAQAMVAQYEVDLDTANRDVGELVDALCSAGLVEQ
jgi:hypothetical protein